MDNGALLKHESVKRLYTSHGTVALNNKYAAVLSDGEVSITNLERIDEVTPHLPCPTASGWGPSVVALSKSWPDLCAVSIGSITHIFDLNTHSPKYILPGIGRTVTSISFSAVSSKLIITGHVDGCICVWDLNTPNKPTRRLTAGRGACDAISLSNADPNLLASTHSGALYISDLGGHTAQPICSLRKTYIDAVAWRPTSAGSVLLSNSDGEIEFYQVPRSLQESISADQLDSDGQESDTEVFGEPDGIRNDLRKISSSEVHSRFRSLTWIDGDHFIGLGQNGKSIILYSIDDNYGLTEIWLSKLENASSAVDILDIQGELSLRAIGNESIESKIVPASVAGRLRRNVGRNKSPAIPASSADETEQRNRPSLVVQPSESQSERGSPTMAPQSIAKQRDEDSAFKRTSSQLQQKRRLAQSRTGVKSLASTEHFTAESQETLAPLQDEDSGLPITLDEDDLEPPMPFLSPTIPARRISPNDLSPLDPSDLRPQHLPSSSFDSSIQSTMFDGQDSDDSDDETFVDDMQGSAAFLPGGINVPLPKACGALFAPNGQLLTFFPPKPRPVSKPKEVPVDEPRQDRREGQKTARLFPTFANLQSDFDVLSEDSDSETSDMAEGDTIRNGLLPRFTFQPASFPSQLSWKSQDLNLNRIVSDQQSQHRIIINVHDVLDVCALHPTQQAIAKDYRLLCHAGESGSELCNNNAVVAENAGAVEVAEVWRLLAMLLEDQVPLEVLSVDSLEQDIFVIAKRLRSIDGIGLAADSANHSKHSGKIRWKDHPYGGIWIVRKIFDWAEQRADVQSLACMSSVLSEAERQIAMKHTPSQQSILTHLPMHSLPYTAEIIKDIPNQSTKLDIPMLRRHAATITSLNESPTKLFRSPSHPSTPYLDSSNTPPLSFPSISRQSTRLSASGSASPELPRGSFSAAASAARYYGQALTERLASYGTSPPSKKIDASPSTNTELSSSLPSGSWPGKSVSFASTPSEDTNRRSFSVSAYRMNQDDEEYDSDKTIEDSSLPHTPRSPGSAPVVNIGNQNRFADEISGCSRARLIPHDLAGMVIIWNQYYSELLRSWDMLLQATELEKVMGLACGVPPQTRNAGLGDGGMTPVPISQRRKAVCDICFTATKGIMQICTSCLHSSHLACLEDYIADLEADEEFTCPSGCGCQCSELPYVVQNPSAAPAARPLFRKKTSFTDPRRWRARVEGDTW